MTRLSMLSVGCVLLSGIAGVLAQDYTVTAEVSGPTVIVYENADGTPYVPTTEEKVKAPVSQPKSNPAPPPPPPPPASSPSPQSSPAPSTQLDTKVSTPSVQTTTSHDGKICINFSGGDFHFLNYGSWGTKKGRGAQEASQCFDQVPNGGMFICESECNASGDAAPAKYTKLECTFGGQYANCDMSIVDGFSLPVECHIPDAKPSDKIGGLVDLDSLTQCPSKAGDNSCGNAGAYQPSEAGVSQYFENGNIDKGGKGGNYCVYQFCSPTSDIFFTGTPTISCQVGTRGSHNKRDAEVKVERREIEAQADANLHSRGLPSAPHRHSHRRARPHARNLEQLLYRSPI